MANKRMFSKELVCDRRFNELKSSTKYLFFMLCLYADDEGVVADPKGVVRFHKCSMKDLNKLYETHYLLQFPSGVAIVKHWFAHNYNQKSHIKKSTYQEELQSLFIDERGFYSTKNKDFCRKNAVKMPSNTAVKMPSSIDKNSIDKNSIDKNSIDKNNNIVAVATKSYLVDSNEFIDHFSKICPSLPQIKAMTDKRKKSINSILKQYGQDKFVEVLKKTEASDFLSGRNGKWGSCNIDWIIKPSNFIKILEGNYDNIRQRETEEQKLNKKYKETYIEKNQYNAKAIKVQKSFEDMKKYKEMFSKKGITQNDNG